MKAKIFKRIMTTILSLVMMLSLAPFGIFTGAAADGDNVITIPVTLWNYSDIFADNNNQNSSQYKATVGDINELTVKRAIDLIKAEGDYANGIYTHKTYGTVNTQTNECRLNCLIFSDGTPDAKSYSFVNNDAQLISITSDIASTSYWSDIPVIKSIVNFPENNLTYAIDNNQNTTYTSLQNKDSCSFVVDWKSTYKTTDNTLVVITVNNGSNDSGTVSVGLGNTYRNFSVDGNTTSFTLSFPAGVSFDDLSVSVTGLNNNGRSKTSNRFGIKEISVKYTETLPVETYLVSFDYPKIGTSTYSAYWTGDSKNGSGNRAKIYSGLVATTLDSNNNIVFNVPNADIFSMTDGDNDGKTVYNNVALQLKYNTDTGYYSYDSSENNLRFDPDIMTMILDDPCRGKTEENDPGYLGFFPFDVTEGSRENTSNTFHFGAAVEIGFAMTPTGTVDGTEDGTPITFVFSGDDDVYFYIDKKLTADLGGIHDAAAVYLNFKTNQIILFNPLTAGEYLPGDVNTDYSGSEYKKYVYTNDADGNYIFTESNSDHYSAIQIGQIFNDANGTGVLGVTIENFALQGEHNMKMYYLERGLGRSNLILRYNLAKQDTIEITKSINQNAVSTDALGNVTTTPLSDTAMGKLNLATFKFELSYAITDAQNNFYKKNADGTYTKFNAEAGDPQTRFSVAGKPYRIYNTSYSGAGVRAYTYVASATIDSTSCVELKNNQTARFYDNMRFKGSVNGVEKDLFFVYYSAEIGIDDNAWDTPSWVYSCNLEPTSSPVEGSDSYKFMTHKKASEKESAFINFTYTNTYKNNSASANHEFFAADYGLMAVIDVLKNDYQSTNANFIITGLSTDPAPLASGIYNNKLETPEAIYTIEREVRYLIIAGTTLQTNQIADLLPANRYIEVLDMNSPYTYKIEITEAEYRARTIRDNLVGVVGDIVTDAVEYAQVTMDETTNELANYCAALSDNHDAVVPKLVIRFTPKTFINTPVKIYYTLYTTLATVEQDVYSHTLVSTYLGVTPATVVNYEEDFGYTDNNYEWVSPFTYTGAWNTYGDNSMTEFQEQEGLLSGDAQNSIIYGSDSFVDLYQGDSLGASMLSNGPIDLAKVSFSITGTGFTIYGRVSEISGVIRVKYTDATGKVTSKYIDTVYVGDYLDKAEDVLYHIPVYMVQDLEYGTYSVEMTVARQTKLYNNRYQFWFDGIDVYNPVNMNSTGADIAAAAYTADHALNPKIADVTDMIEGVKIHYSSENTASSADIYTDVRAYVPYSSDDGMATVYKLAYDTDKYLTNNYAELTDPALSSTLINNISALYSLLNESINLGYYVKTDEGIVPYKSDPVYDGLTRYNFLVSEVTDSEERDLLLSENKLWVIKRFTNDATVSRLYGPKNEVYMISDGCLNLSLEGWNDSLMVEGDEQIYLGIKTPNGVTATITFSVYKNGATEPELIELEIANTTNAYYNVTEYVSDDDFIYIQVNPGVDAPNIVSFTSIIVTGNDNFHLFDIPNNNELRIEGTNG